MVDYTELIYTVELGCLLFSTGRSPKLYLHLFPFLRAYAENHVTNHEIIQSPERQLSPRRSHVDCCDRVDVVVNSRFFLPTVRRELHAKFLRIRQRLLSIGCKLHQTFCLLRDGERMIPGAVSSSICSFSP
jgi:hypothetical protein